MVTSCRELRVYRAAFKAQLKIYDIVTSWPRFERFLLVQQILRSSRSVCVNIAEAWRKRRYPAAFVAKLSDAEGEAEETRVHLQIAVACGYLDPAVAAELDATYDGILAGLTRMSQDPGAWTPRSAPRPPSSRDKAPAEKASESRSSGERLSPDPAAVRDEAPERSEPGDRPRSAGRSPATETAAPEDTG